MNVALSIGGAGEQHQEGMWTDNSMVERVQIFHCGLQWPEVSGCELALTRMLKRWWRRLYVDRAPVLLIEIEDFGQPKA